MEGVGDIDPIGEPDGGSMANYERVVGAAVLRGEIDATEALRALQRYEEWRDLGEPKLGESYV